MPTLGVFHELWTNTDFLWNQCDGPLGNHGPWTLVGPDPKADVALVMNFPVWPGYNRKQIGLRRHLYKLTGQSLQKFRIEQGYQWLSRPRESTFALIYEPPDYVPDWWYDLSKKYCSRVYGPDSRATHPCVLPSMWTFEDDLAALKSMPPPPKQPIITCINSGTPAGKRLIPGHNKRMEFFHSLVAANVPVQFFGRGMPSTLSSGGSVASKANVLRPAMFALAIENFDQGDQYITEKLWDALLCWCLPLYFGPRAIEKLLPPDSFIRLPDLGPAGIETVKRVLANPDMWEQRREAIAEARRLALGPLRIVEWAAANLH